MKKLDCRTKKFSRHAVAKMFQRNITKSEIDNVIVSGQVINEYPDDSPFPSFLLFGFYNNRPLHIVIAFNNSEHICIIVTVYIPDPKLWTDNYIPKGWLCHKEN